MNQSNCNYEGKDVTVISWSCLFLLYIVTSILKINCMTQPKIQTNINNIKVYSEHRLNYDRGMNNCLFYVKIHFCRLGNTMLNSTCSSNCNCESTDYLPVCGSDNRNYLTPCHAGCLDSVMGPEGLVCLNIVTEQKKCGYLAQHSPICMEKVSIICICAQFICEIYMQNRIECNTIDQSMLCPNQTHIGHHIQ